MTKRTPIQRRSGQAGSSSHVAPHEVPLEDEHQLERDLLWAIHDVNRFTGRIFDRHMRKIGLTQAQSRVVAHLRREDGLTQTELADLLDMERAPLGKLVDRLEEAGWVQRGADSSDRRVKRVFITDKFGEVVARMQELAPTIFEMSHRGISERDLEATLRTLRRMKANLMDHEAARAREPEDAEQG